MMYHIGVKSIIVGDGKLAGGLKCVMELLSH